MFDLEDVVRMITGYSRIPNKNGNYLALVEYRFLRPVSLDFLQRLFNINPNDPNEDDPYLIDCYVIDETKAKALQPFIKEKLDLNKYSFALECSKKSFFLKKGVEHYILSYQKDSQRKDSSFKIVKEYKLIKPISLTFLKKLFDIKKEHEDYENSYEINEEQAIALQPFFKEKLDTRIYRLVIFWR